MNNPSVEWCQWIYYKFLSPLCHKLFRNFTPNQITVFNFLFTIFAGGFCLSRGTWFWNLCGLGVLLTNGFLDYVDGDIAKSTNQMSLSGQWLDKGGDMIIQNIIMASVAYALCVHQFSNTTILICIVYFIGINAMNMISVFYNNTFGFDSHVGNEFFRDFMDYKKETRDRSMLLEGHIYFQDLFNWFMKNLIDPTASLLGLILWTVRYFLVFGILCNQMFLAFFIITILLTFRWIVMFILYAMHLSEYKGLWTLHALAVMDRERQEYYKARGQ